MQITEAVIDPNAVSFSEDEAHILCRRVLDCNLEMQWVGPIDKLVTCTLDALREIAPTSEGHSFNEGLKALPWPIEVVGPHSYIPDAVYLRRLS